MEMGLINKMKARLGHPSLMGFCSGIRNLVGYPEIVFQENSQALPWNKRFNEL